LGSFNRPTKEFERCIKLGKIFIDNNEITKWMFSNVALKRDFNENVKPVKGGDESGKIDGVISNVQALGGYLTEPHWNNII
jgi:phage terminase large subunit-like protein